MGNIDLKKWMDIVNEIKRWPIPLDVRIGHIIVARILLDNEKRKKQYLDTLTTLDEFIDYGITENFKLLTDKEKSDEYVNHIFEVAMEIAIGEILPTRANLLQNIEHLTKKQATDLMLDIPKLLTSAVTGSKVTFLKEGEEEPND